MLAERPRNKFCASSDLSLTLAPTGQVCRGSCQLPLQLRPGSCLATLPFWQRSSGWLLSSRFNHGRPNWADRFQLCTSRRGRAGCALLRNVCFSFHRRGGGRDSSACGCGGLRARPACSGWLRNGSLTSSLARERSGRAHLLKRRRYGFLFAGLGFESCRRRRFRRGFLRLRRRRCFPRSLRFCFTRNDYFLRVHLPDEGKAAE